LQTIIFNRLTGQLFNSLLKGSAISHVSHVYERNAGFPDLKGKGAYRLPVDKNKEFLKSIQVEKPAHPSTFLYTFGAGMREDVSDDVQEKTLDQVLTLLNGNLSRTLVYSIEKKDSYYAVSFEKNKDAKKLVKELYLSLTGREPGPEEWEYILLFLENPYAGKSRSAVFPGDLLADIAWGVINSEEFLYVY